MFLRSESRWRGWSAAALVAAMALLGFVGVRADADAQEWFGRRRQMLEMTNDDRVRHDRGALGFAARLSRYARRHSAAMARRDDIFHSTEVQLRGALEGYRWSLAGENVGVGGSLQDLERAFMESPLHRQNILRPVFQRAAVGVVRERGRLWVTVIFYG